MGSTKNVLSSGIFKLVGPGQAGGSEGRRTKQLGGQCRETEFATRQMYALAISGPLTCWCCSGTLEGNVEMRTTSVIQRHQNESSSFRLQNVFSIHRRSLLKKNIMVYLSKKYYVKSFISESYFF